jgi:DNA-binding Lrp family transcriptional regulator
MCEIAQSLINQGREEGLIDGAVNALAGLVREGRLTIAEAAQRVGISEETFTEKMKKFNE